jgi:hypothetical protein
MAKETEISASVWLAVRERVADAVKEQSTVQTPARIRIAEELITRGYIDIEFVRAQIAADEAAAKEAAKPKTRDLASGGMKDGR